jgi:uncharacterized protein YndB with AHSA1/START domain
MGTTDKIEKRITLRAPVSRVWRALTDSREFGSWFGFTFDEPFEEGRAMKGTFNGKLDEAAIIAAQKSSGIEPSGIRIPEKNSTFCTIERLEPERRFSFRWIPYGIDADIDDPKNEPTTLVEFELEPVAEGTLLTVVESGFDRVPAKRRARAFRMNDGGWAAQLENVRKYVEGA